jgi:P4 family phage/plasmid primase-like protien
MIETVKELEGQYGGDKTKSALASETDGKELVDRYGFPAFKNEKGKLSKLNEPFWAAYYAAHEPEMLFEADEEEFYYYDEGTGLFRLRSVDLIRKKLAEQILERARAWPALAELERFRNEPALRGVLAHLRGEVEQHDAFCFGGKIIHLANCVLEVQPDGSFTECAFSPKYRSRNRSPIVYDQSATCPQFEKALLEHLEEDHRELLQKYAGQCLLGRNLTQRILVLDGIGSASKSAFVLLARGIVGATNVYELRTKHLAERFEIGRMVGKTLLLGADVKAEFLSEAGAYRLKALVGGDTLEAERKISNKQFWISGNFNVMITSNSRLRVHLEGDQSAWRRRLAIVRYERPYSGKTVPDIHEQLLRAEGSGILNFFLEGVQKLFRDIQETGSLMLSERQRQLVNALLSESDSLRIFLRENLCTSHKCDLTVAEIITEYNRYAIDVGWTPIPIAVAQRQLDDLMLELFGVAKVNCVKRDGKAQRGFFNIRFRQDDEPDPPNQ